MHKKNHKKKHKGGYKYIGEGSYGCVFRPGILCDGETEYAKNEVSKLMDIQSAQEELEQNEMFDRIDPNYSMHLETKNLCKFNKEINPNLEIDQCNLYDSDYDYAVLKLQDGGTSLEKFLYDGKNITFENMNLIISQFSHIINGLSLMNDNGIIHADIKLPNIVVDTNSTGINTLRIYFIDFGISQQLSNFKIDRIFSSNYIVWPPESYLLSYPLNSPASDITIKLLKRNLLEYTKERNDNINELNLKNKQHNINITEEILINLFKHDRNNILPEIFEKFDIYSLGRVLYNILYIYGIFLEKNYKKFNITGNNIKEYFEIFKFIISGMIDFNFKTRFTTNETKFLYTLVLIKNSEIISEYYIFTKNTEKDLIQKEIINLKQKFNTYFEEYKKYEHKKTEIIDFCSNYIKNFIPTQYISPSEHFFQTPSQLSSSKRKTMKKSKFFCG